MDVVPPLTRFEGCLLGGAIGDALGYPIEFESPGAALIARYGSAAPDDLCCRRDAHRATRAWLRSLKASWVDRNPAWPRRPTTAKAAAP